MRTICGTFIVLCIITALGPEDSKTSFELVPETDTSREKVNMNPFVRRHKPQSRMTQLTPQARQHKIENTRWLVIDILHACKTDKSLPDNIFLAWFRNATECMLSPLTLRPIEAGTPITEEALADQLFEQHNCEIGILKLKNRFRSKRPDRVVKLKDGKLYSGPLQIEPNL